MQKLYAAFEATKAVPGFFILHMTVNPYIEIAPDGMTARSHWLSPGVTYAEAKREPNIFANYPELPEPC